MPIIASIETPVFLADHSIIDGGAFWEDRHHCALVDGGEHAFNCIRYIDLNMGPGRSRIVT